MNTQLIREVGLAGNKSPSVTLKAPVMTVTNPNPNQIVYKVHGTDFGRLGNMMIRTAPENKRGNYVHFPSIKIDTNKTIPDLSDQSFAKVFSRNPIQSRRSFKDLKKSTVNQSEELSLAKKIKFDYSEMNQKKRDNFGYNIDDVDVAEHVSKQELFIEFKEKVYKLARLKAPNMTGLNGKPFEWNAQDVQTFLKNNLVNFENFKFNPSMV